MRRSTVRLAEQAWAFMGWQGKKHRGTDPRQKTVADPQRRNYAGDSARGLLKSHLGVAANDRNTRAASGD